MPSQESPSIQVIPRPNMRKYGTLFEIELDGKRLCRKDGTPRRNGSVETAKRAAKIAADELSSGEMK